LAKGLHPSAPRWDTPQGLTSLAMSGAALQQKARHLMTDGLYAVTDVLGTMIREEQFDLELLGMSLLGVGVSFGTRKMMQALGDHYGRVSASDTEVQEAHKHQEEGAHYVSSVEDPVYKEGELAGQGYASGHEHAGESEPRRPNIYFQEDSASDERRYTPRWLEERGMSLMPESRHGVQALDGFALEDLTAGNERSLIPVEWTGKDHLRDIWQRPIPLLQKLELSVKQTLFGDDPWRWNGVPAQFKQPSTLGSELRGFGKELVNVGFEMLDFATGSSGLQPRLPISPSEIDGANAAKLLTVVGVFSRGAKAGAPVASAGRGVEGTVPFKLGPMTAREANTSFLERGMKPPYDAGVRPRNIQLQNDKVFVRAHGEKNQISNWVMRPKEVEGLTPAQIQSKFSLPKTPKHISTVEVPSGVTVRVGRAAGQEGWGVGSGMQYEVLSPVKKQWFSKPELLEEQLRQNLNMRN
jgi:hypothetical protein